MPLPETRRTKEYVQKGIESVLRELAAGPELRSARRLRDHMPMVDHSGRRVLMLIPRNWVEHVQYESMLAQALRLRGAEVSAMTCGGGLDLCDRANTFEAPPMPCRTCTRYTSSALDAHGIPWTAIRAGWEQPAVDPLRDGGWPDLDELSLGELFDVEADGLPLGKLVDVPVKWFLCSADLTHDPLALQITRGFLRSARRIARGIAHGLDHHRPDTVVLLSGLFLFEAIAWELCRARGIDVVSFERAFIRETLVFDREQPAGFYDFSAVWPRVRRNLTPGEEVQLTEYLTSRRQGQAFDQYWTPAETTVGNQPGRLALLLTNLTWDTAVIGRDRAFTDIRAWLDRAVQELAAMPEHRLVIRVHPSELHLPGKPTRDSLATYLHQRFPTLPPNIHVIPPEDSTSSYPYIDAADVGLVYTSTTGLELALAGTPVIVAAQTHYRGKGFTDDVSTPDEFAAVLRRSLADPTTMTTDVDEARRYAHFFFFRAPFDAPFVSEPLPGLARLRTEDPAQLAPGAHAMLDRLCAGILDGTPFVQTDDDSGGDG